MSFEEVPAQVVELLRRQGRVSYRALRLRFDLDDDYMEGLKEELIYAQQLASDEDGRVLVWKGQPEQRSVISPQETPVQRPIAYTPRHLAERILAEQQALQARGAPDGERKTITALFADIKGSMDLLENVDPEDARQLIDPALTLMMEAVHRYEGYVAQSLDDGIFALFGAPIADEDHAQRALYAALRMQAEMRRYADRVRLERGVALQMRVGVNTGEVVVRSIRTDDLHTDYVPIGHATSLAARIDRLPAAEKALLQTLAVLGKEFAWSLLTQVTDQPDEELQRLLAHLQAEEFIYEQPAFPELAYTFKHALTQEVAYNAVLLERRRVVHERAAQAIEGLFPERLPEHFSALAHHYSCSGNTPKAVDYLHRAGQQAVERSAYAEAVSHLTTALDLLTALPESRARSQQELAVQMTLGPALRATKGGSAPEGERLNTRARELCEQVGEPPQLFRVLWGFWLMYNARGDHQTMRALGEQLLSLAQRLEDPDLLLEAHHALWTSLFSGGELTAARMHQEQGLRLYDPQRHRTHAALYSGHDPGVCCRYRAAPALWLLGTPTRRWPAARQRWPWPSSSPTLESRHCSVLGCCAASPAPGSVPNPGTSRGRHDSRDRPGVSATIRAGNTPARLGAGREWTRGGGHHTDPARRLRSDESDKGPTVSPGPAR
jgi:class 3 adenylate cyclase